MGRARAPADIPAPPVTRLLALDAASRKWGLAELHLLTWGPLVAVTALQRNGPRRAVDTPAITAGLPTSLKVLWTVWLTCTLVNLAVWLLVSLRGHDVVYFWPVWLAVPGVVLLGVTFGVSGSRRR